MAECSQSQNNYVSSPADLVYGLSNLIYNIANTVTVKTNEILNVIEKTTIDSHSILMAINQSMYEEHIRRNIQQKQIINEVLGSDSHINGTSDSYTPSIVKPEIIDEINYLNFAEHINEKENGGLTTRKNTVSTNNKEIREFNVDNYYPQEIDGTVGNKTWVVGCETNSLLYKTQKLFNDKKINTIISRFGTNTENNSINVQYSGQVKTSYGESRGRNLLTKDAESGGGGYTINGYKNPYCRTWTNHYRYDSIYKTMRPFTTTDTSGRYVGNNESSKLINVNNWNQYEEHTYAEELLDDGKTKKEKKWSWRKNNDGYNKSVMSDGLINFAPMYKNGGNSNIHTRQCMFSIENLAWKDFNPYAFENTLSWEQRGPNGGRIMWFPPYGLTFNETTQAKWQAHQFIGRGEDVYTYQGTVRSGTLSFMLVVDHPSIIDYVFGKHNTKSRDLNDNDIHRYFAGCDNDILTRYAQPTPLTDEYSAYIDYGSALLHEDLELKKEKNKPIPTPSTSPNKITFYWYFPNNYSGVYDNKELNSSNGVVSAMKYTLMGVGGGIKRNMKVSKKEWTPQPDSILDTSETLGNSDLCTGYCMGKKTPDSLGDEYLLPQQTPRFLSSTKKNNQSMKNVKDKGRFYRVDYDPSFKWPTGEEAYKNTLDQECGSKRKVENNYDYNINVPIKSENENEKNYSFLLMVCALMEISEKQPKLLLHLKEVYKTELDITNENSEYRILVDLLKKVKENKIIIKSITSKGFSSIQQSNTEEGKKRNEYLATQRAETMKTLFNSSGISQTEIQITVESNASVGTNDSNESGENETKNRRAELVIEFETEQTENTATTPTKDVSLDEQMQQQAKIENYNEIHKYIGYTKTDQIVEINGKQYYLYLENKVNEDDEERYWYNEDDWIGRVDEENKSLTENDVQNQDKTENENNIKNKEFLKEKEQEENQAQENKEPLISIGIDVNNPPVFMCEVNKKNTLDIPVRTFNIESDLNVKITLNDNPNDCQITTEPLKLSKEELLKGGQILKLICTPYIYIKESANTCSLLITLETQDEINGNKISKTFGLQCMVEDKEVPLVLTCDELLETVVVSQKTNWRLYDEDIIKTGKFAGVKLKERKNEKNNLRYDQEYYFFRKLEEADPMIYETLVKRLQYFDPTFHSMTPEGFNGRLTFLQQCMRQGDTLTELEHKGIDTEHIVTAKNLAFGRPPFCVLRIGDFYNQTIIIENLSINYDFDGGIKWDLNAEGIGVQPLLAQVQLSIKLLGGSDLSGPIRRLQNAMSFNYYANTSLYDNRADRYDYEINEKTAQKGNLLTHNCFVYDAFTKTENIRKNYIKTNIKEKINQQMLADQNFGKEIAPQVKTIDFTANSVVMTPNGLKPGPPITHTIATRTESGLTYVNGNKDGYKEYNWENDTHKPIKKEETNNTPPSQNENNKEETT